MDISITGVLKDYALLWSCKLLLLIWSWS